MHVYRGLICLEWFGCERIKAFEGAKYHGSWGGRGLGDQLAGGARRTPTNHNGGSSANCGVFRPGGMLGPFACSWPPPPPPGSVDTARVPVPGLLGVVTL